MHPLRVIVAERAIRPVLFWSFVARLPLGLVFEALLFGVQKTTGSLALAGTVTGVASLCTAMAAPLQGRLLDRTSKPRIITCFAAAQALALLVLAGVVYAGDAPAMLLVVLAAAAGGTIPSVTAMTRLTLKRTLPSTSLNTAYSLDATSLEIIFIAGPTLAALGTVLWDPAVIFAGSAALVLVGTGGFLATAGGRLRKPPAGIAESGTGAEDGSSERGTAGRDAGYASPLRRRRMPVIWFVAAIALSALPLGMVESSLIQLTVERQTSIAPVGVALSVLSAGSLVGGLAYAAVSWRARPSVQFVALSLLQAGLLLLLLPEPGFVAITTLLAAVGLFVVPLMSLTFLLLDRMSPPENWAQTQSWGGAANTAGSAAGITLGGAVAGASGSFIGILAATGIAFVSIAVALPAFRALSER